MTQSNLDKLYHELYRAQITKNWGRVDKLQKEISKLEGADNTRIDVA